MHFPIGEENPWNIDWWSFSGPERITDDNLYIQQVWTKFPSFIHEKIKIAHANNMQVKDT